jgi:hypothetical protein
MVSDDLEAAGLPNEIRKELIDYYKWIVNLSIFVLTISLTVSGVFRPHLRYGWLLVIGWMLLGICIFLNWLIVKRLTTAPIVFATDKDQRTHLHQAFINSMRNVQLYGLWQNWAFLLGVFAIVIGFSLNLFARDSAEKLPVVIKTSNQSEPGKGADR